MGLLHRWTQNLSQDNQRKSESRTGLLLALLEINIFLEGTADCRISGNHLATRRGWIQQGVKQNWNGGMQVTSDNLPVPLNLIAWSYSYPFILGQLTISGCNQKILTNKLRWAPKNWCFWTVVLEKTLESPLDCKEIQPVHSKGDQPWVFIGRTDAKAATPVLWPPHEKSWLTGKDSDAGRDWGQEEKGTTEDEMAGWHHWLNGH